MVNGYVGIGQTQALMIFLGGQAAQSAAKTAKEGVKTASANSLMGISVQEAKQILNVEKIDKELINEV